jgi:hypothetical protein
MKNRNLDHSDNWKTPPAFYEKLNATYQFDFDPCPLNHDISLWDGLKVEWGMRNYINSPYSQKLKEEFIKKAILESNKGKLCVMLLPVSTSTKCFHKLIKPNAKKIIFVEGRISFIGINQKGQFVNYHLIQEVDKSTIEYNTGIIDKETGLVRIIDIPKYVKNSGQHDSMIVVFYK